MSLLLDALKKAEQDNQNKDSDKEVLTEQNQTDQNLGNKKPSDQNQENLSPEEQLEHSDDTNAENSSQHTEKLSVNTDTDTDTEIGTKTDIKANDLNPQTNQLEPNNTIAQNHIEHLAIEEHDTLKQNAESDIYIAGSPYQDHDPIQDKIELSFDEIEKIPANASELEFELDNYQPDTHSLSDSTTKPVFTEKTQTNEPAYLETSSSPSTNPDTAISYKIGVKNPADNPYSDLHNNRKLALKRIRLIIISAVFAFLLAVLWWYLSSSLKTFNAGNVKQLPPLSKIKPGLNIAKANEIKTTNAKPDNINNSGNSATKPINASKSGITQPTNTDNKTQQSKTNISPNISLSNHSKKTEKVNSDGIIYPNDNVYIADLTKNTNSANNVIKIKKDNTPVQSDHQLLNAYTAYQKGDFKQAKIKYNQHLATNPLDRDALLGLAAIAIHNKNPLQAQNYYYQLLQINPQDNLALTGLLALEKISSINRESIISRLKILIKQDDKAAHLYFTLGNLYIAENRWLDAQRAFFNAHHLDSTNPDYLYNLAVSLDQLGEAKTAARYYQQAIKQSKNNNFNFNRVTALKRLHYLQGRKR